MKNKKVDKKEKNNKRFWSALALGLLIISGGVFALPAVNADDSANQIQRSVEVIQKNPERFLDIGNFYFTSDFDYLDELNKEFVRDYPEIETKNSVNEGAVINALNSEDYEAWKESLQNLPGYPQNLPVMSREDFELLVKIRKTGN